MIRQLLVTCGVWIVFSTPQAHGWGLDGHKIITDRAARLIPTKMQEFYLTNRESLRQLCIDPDLRKDADKSEGPKHYIDLEHYPADLPSRRAEAVERFGMRKLASSGWVLWNTQDVFDQLVQSMRDRDYPAILRLSGDLSHYVADAHVPLHTTENYDGQLTTDTGIHARFESRLVEQFPESLPFEPRAAERIEDIPAKLLAIVRESRTFVKDVFDADRKNAYAGWEDGYSIAKAAQSHAPAAARRMNDAAWAVASFWYTAWIAAGRPDLPRVDFSELVPPRPSEGGDAVFYEGRYLKGIPDEWPGEVRRNFDRIGDYLKSEPNVRLAEIGWEPAGRGEHELKVEFLERMREAEFTGLRKNLIRLVKPVHIKIHSVR